MVVRECLHARLMDLNGGMLNLKVLSLLHMLKNNNNKKYIQCMVPPSASTVQHVFKKIKEVGDVMLPYTLLYNNDNNEAVDFFKHMHIMHQLMSVLQLE